MAIPAQPDDGLEETSGGGELIFAEINITPLTDVFLVMVVIFMVSALAVQAERSRDHAQAKPHPDETAGAVAITLPPGGATDVALDRVTLVVVVPLAGDVYVGGKPMPDGALDNLFHAAFQRDKQTQVVLRADQGVAHGRVVNLMERAKQAGLSRLAIGTGGAR